MSTHSDRVSDVATELAPTGRAAPSGRAAPMSRDDRRAAIVAATLPLLRRQGPAVTTRQIAEASGIGEGTIFRVFTDKAELIDACLAAAFDQRPTLEQLAGVDRDLPLPDRLEAAVAILQRRLTSVIELLIALGFPQPPGPDGARRPGLRTGRGDNEVLQALTELLHTDRDQLRVSPHEVATLTRLITFAASHPKINDRTMTPSEITELLLHGVSRESTC